MSLADELAEAKKLPALGPRCGVWHVLQELGDEAPALEEAMRDTTFRGSTIAKVLRARGHALNDSTIRRHRKGECQCPRPSVDSPS